MTESAGRAPIWVRVLFVVVALAAWFATQRLIGQREAQPGAIYDSVHVWLEVPHRYLQEHPAAAKGLLIVSSAVIDGLGIFLLLRSVLGPTVRPFLGLLILFAMRQICQLLCASSPAGHDLVRPGLSYSAGDLWRRDRCQASMASR